jgi:hypothetical protein
MNVQSGAIRNDHRRPFECPIVISWQERSGETKVIRAKCLDLSQQGARIVIDLPIEIRTSVYLQSPSHGQLGNATVRHCSRTGLKYTIGLLFSSASSQADEGRKRCITAILTEYGRE